LKEEGHKNLEYWNGNIRKYLSPNPLVKLIVGKFLRDVNMMAQYAKCATVLDVGCGEGFISRYLKAHNKNMFIQGLDISQRALQVAKYFDPHSDLLRASVYNIPCKDESFDIAVCCELLEHLIDPERAVLEAKRVSKRFVILSVPRDPYFRAANVLRLKYLRRLGSPPVHIWNWTEKRFLRLLRKHFKEYCARASTLWIVALCKVN